MMIPTIAVAVLQALPGLIKTGFDIYGLVTHVNENAQIDPTPTEEFAAQILLELPGLIDAGKNVIGLVNASADRVALMVRENRAPTDAEKADQTARLAALDAGYDDAAAPRT